ncbi:hypothetical protein T261_00677 [Streptomyces lydicus]|nr:hypothetical protein T261_00677 [Streptomyces lydicus]
MPGPASLRSGERAIPPLRTACADHPVGFFMMFCVRLGRFRQLSRRS